MTESIFEIHHYMREKNEQLQQLHLDYNLALQKKVFGGVHMFSSENFLGKGILVTFHFHYSDGPKVSIHPMHDEELCDQYSISFINIEYMITVKDLDPNAVRELHNRLVMAEIEEIKSDLLIEQ